MPVASIVTVSVMTTPAARSTEPIAEAAKVMTSAPGFAFACATASGNEPAPLFSKFVTVYVAASTGAGIQKPSDSDQRGRTEDRQQSLASLSAAS